MSNLVLRYPATDLNKLERWMGKQPMLDLAAAMKGWYYLPIGLAGVPGNVSVGADGDFCGRITEGAFSSAMDRFENYYLRMRRAWRRAARSQQLNAGFASFNDLIAEATSGGKRREFQFQKIGSTGVAGATSSLWRSGGLPAAGAAPGNAPGGTVYDDSSTGAYAFTNPTGGDTQHFVSGWASASVSSNTLLLYDLLFGCNKTMNSSATEAVTGVPTRYQNQTGGNPDYIGGNFLFVQVGGTALAATAHNWTTCLYTDQGGASSTLPSLTGNSSAIVDRLDHPTFQWFAPLESGDVGIKALTQMQCSALVATGVIWFMIGHPIAWMPCLLGSVVCTIDGLSTAFNLARIFDDACLAFLEVVKPSTTATTYNMGFTTVAG